MFFKKKEKEANVEKFELESHADIVRNFDGQPFYDRKNLGFIIAGDENERLQFDYKQREVLEKELVRYNSFGQLESYNYNIAFIAYPCFPAEKMELFLMLTYFMPWPNGFEIHKILHMDLDQWATTICIFATYDDIDLISYFGADKIGEIDPYALAVTYHALYLKKDPSFIKNGAGKDEIARFAEKLHKKSGRRSLLKWNLKAPLRLISPGNKMAITFNPRRLCFASGSFINLENYAYNYMYEDRKLYDVKRFIWEYEDCSLLFRTRLENEAIEL